MDANASLKDAVIKALRASPALSAFVGSRIFDVTPQEPNLPSSPYIRMGPYSAQDDGAECFDSSDVTGQIDIFSWGSGEALSTMEASKIAAIVKSIINGMQDVTELQGGFTLSDIRYRSHRTITASDGKTKHVPLTFTAIVDGN